MALTRKSLTALLVLVPLTLVGCTETPEDEAAAPADSDSSAECAEPTFDDDGALEPLPSGFPESAITIVSVDEPGSRDGVYARTLDQALNDISPVDIVVSDEPRAQGGTIDTVVDVMDREGGTEGYHLVVSSVLGTSTDFHAVDYEGELGVSLEDLDFFVATEEYPYVLAQRADAPWGEDFASFVEYGQANPGELRYISGGVGSATDITMEWLLNELDIEVTKVPAADRTAAIAAVGGGQGDFTFTQPEIALGAEEQGRAKVIFTSTEEAPDEWAGEVATAADYADYGIEEATWGTVEGLVVPAEVPDCNVDWLRALIVAATETDVYQQRAETQAGITLRLYDGEQGNALAQTLFEFSEPVVREAGLHWEDQ